MIGFFAGRLVAMTANLSDSDLGCLTRALGQCSAAAGSPGLERLAAVVIDLLEEEARRRDATRRQRPPDRSTT